MIMLLKREGFICGTDVTVPTLSLSCRQLESWLSVSVHLKFLFSYIAICDANFTIKIVMCTCMYTTVYVYVLVYVSM